MELLLVEYLAEMRVALKAAYLVAYWVVMMVGQMEQPSVGLTVGKKAVA